MIERKIIIGLIVSDDFLQQILPVWDSSLLEAATAQRISRWCIEYYEQYKRAPREDIEIVYFQKLKEEKISPEESEWIEDIISSLNNEYLEQGINLGYLLEETHRYLKERKLRLLGEDILYQLDKGDTEKAEKLALDFRPPVKDTGDSLDLNSPAADDRIDKAFNQTREILIRYPRALGKFWNNQLVRGGFVALMAPEKRGKTFWLLDMAMRGVKQKNKVVFFQAGDMTEDEQLIRICVYLARKSNEKRYSGEMYQPVRDCIRNQMDTCDRVERESTFGVFSDKTEQDIRKITFEELKQVWKDNPEYRPCTNCPLYTTHHWGVPWLEKINTGEPLTAKEAKQWRGKFFQGTSRLFRLSTHPNGTLSVQKIESLLDKWIKQDDFVPDIVVVDYADLLVAEKTKDFRHQQNEIWKGLRRISQEFHCLVVTATQTDAASYEQDRLRLKNFSEDKRKYAHVTAMYGLNQDREGREKKLKIMRINEILLRKGDYDINNEVTVLMNLQRGVPYLSSML